MPASHNPAADARPTWHARDRLKLFEDIETVFTEDQARVLSKALYRVTEARRDELSTKLDLPNLKTRRVAKPVALGGKIILVSLIVAQFSIAIAILLIFP